MRTACAVLLVGCGGVATFDAGIDAGHDAGVDAGPATIVVTLIHIVTDANGAADCRAPVTCVVSREFDAGHAEAVRGFYFDAGCATDGGYGIDCAELCLPLSAGGCCKRITPRIGSSSFTCDVWSPP